MHNAKIKRMIMQAITPTTINPPTTSDHSYALVVSALDCLSTISSSFFPTSPPPHCDSLPETATVLTTTTFLKV